MKDIRIARMILLLSVLFWFIETWYFGWNDTPINKAEITCDRIVEYGILIAIGIYLSPLARYYEKKVKQWEEQK